MTISSQALGLTSEGSQTKGKLNIKIYSTRKKLMLTSSEIKQSILGLLLSDGYLDKSKRFAVSSKNIDFRNHCASLFASFPNSEKKVWLHSYFDKRFETTTHIMVASYPAYFEKFKEWVYPNGKKELLKIAVDKIDARSLAYMWMGDGYLRHAINKKANKLQNVGWLCLEAFEKLQLEYFCNVMNEKYQVDFRLSPVIWGKGYRVKISGMGLQRFISLVYPYITPTFMYKTKLFYRSLKYCDYSLPSAEHYLVWYQDLQDYEDIVETYKKL
jgi:hypothetical protein